MWYIFEIHQMSQVDLLSVNVPEAADPETL